MKIVIKHDVLDKLLDPLNMICHPLFEQSGKDEKCFVLRDKNQLYLIIYTEKCLYLLVGSIEWILKKYMLIIKSDSYNFIVKS